MTKQPQHLGALERANAIRLARAKLKRGLAAGEHTLADLIAGEVPECLRSIAVAELIEALPRWGTKRAGKMLDSLGITHTRPLGELSPRQRRWLIERAQPEQDAA